MDPEVTLQFEDDLILSADRPTPLTSPTLVPSPIAFPSVPPPSLSRSTSTTHLRLRSISGGPPPSSPGLDMNSSPQRYTSRFAGSAPTSPARTADYFDAGAGLDDEVYRARQARASRHNSRTQSISVAPAALEEAASSVARLPPPGRSAPLDSRTFTTSAMLTDDPRDMASARENITKLAGGGAARDGASLASFMGGGARPPPLHRVNQGMTEAEREETDKLEQEMRAKKARWGPESDEPAKPRGNSLADLMKSRAPTDSPVAASVANRWTVAEPVKSTSAPTPLESSARVLDPPVRPPFSASPATSFTRPVPASPAAVPIPSSSKPALANGISLAAAFGSKASGPRLNQPAASIAADEGPVHARARGGSGAVAMPGMVAAGTVRERTRSFGTVSTPTSAAAAVVETKVITRSPPVTQTSVEAKVFTRSPPIESTPNFRPTSPVRPESPIRPASPDKAPSVLPRSSAFTSEPLGIGKNPPTASLTRLQSSNIVADRLGKFAEPSAMPDGSKTGQGKRGSVVGRWGRDQPDTAPSTAPSSPVPLSRTISSKSEEPEPASDIKVPTPGHGYGIANLPVNSSPPLVHLNRNRARPAKSTARTLPSPSVEPKSVSSYSLPSVIADVEMAEPSEPPARFDPSPRFDSPVGGDDESWGSAPLSRDPTRDEPLRGWSGPPIGVKEVKRSAEAFQHDEAPPVKHSRGVALPGMSAPPPASPTKATSEDPTMSRLIASQYETTRGVGDIQVSARYLEAERPSAMAVASSLGEAHAAKPTLLPLETNPWSRTATTPSRERTTSIPASTAAKRISRIDFEEDEVPRSPGGTLRDRMAMFSNPSPAPAYNAAAIKESYGVKLSSDPRPSRSRQTSADFTSRLAAYSATAPAAPAADPLPSRLFRQPSKSSLAPSKPSAPIEIFAISASEPTKALVPGAVFSEDVLAVVDRTGKAGTKVWVWKGKDAVENTRAIDEFSQQHATKAVVVPHMHETAELVALLGSPLIIRKGTRASYDDHTPCLLRAQGVGDSVVLDQLPIAPPSLCAGYSFVLASTGDVYAWHGRGASAAERRAASKVAKELAAGRPVSELNEGAEPRHFWHSLGATSDDEYSSSNTWRFRPSLPPQHLTVHAVDSARVYQLPAPTLPTSSISIIDSALELWVVVPPSHRANAADLRAAFASTDTAAAGWKAKGLPCRPPQHVLFFPTRVPRDLAHLCRRFDFESLNDGKTLKTIDVFTVAEARASL